MEEDDSTPTVTVIELVELASLRNTEVVEAVKTEVALKVVSVPMRLISSLIAVNSSSSAVRCELFDFSANETVE